MDLGLQTKESPKFGQWDSKYITSSSIANACFTQQLVPRMFTDTKSTRSKKDSTVAPTANSSVMSRRRASQQRSSAHSPPKAVEVGTPSASNAVVSTALNYRSSIDTMMAIPKDLHELHSGKPALDKENEKGSKSSVARHRRQVAMGSVAEPTKSPEPQDYSASTVTCNHQSRRVSRAGDRVETQITIINGGVASKMHSFADVSPASVQPILTLAEQPASGVNVNV